MLFRSYKYLDGNKVYLECPSDILNNNYLIYKNKYAIWNGVVQKVKFSHIEVEYFNKNEFKVYKYENYDEIPREFIAKANVYYIYEIMQEN